MKLKSVKYSQFPDKANHWKIEDLNLGHINLIVGKNGSGKTKTLNLIKGIADLLSGSIKLTYLSGYYDVVFEDDSTEINYKLEYENGKVSTESLTIGKENRFKRDADGKGEIWNAEQNNYQKFQTPSNTLTSVSRRDSIQHPYFESLFQWADNLRYYAFGTNLGKDRLTDKSSIANPHGYNSKDSNFVVKMFYDGKKKFGPHFLDMIISDMKSIGYNLKEIMVGSLKSVIIETNLPVEFVGLNVQENDLDDITDQSDMSQGMFRALSLIIQINYNFLSQKPSCILIDDIGEGLDFERSSSLIKILIEKTKNVPTQLIMATNDRFVMNQVPLSHWSIISRTSHIVKFYNYNNSKEVFDKFESMGLNNFDFFSSNYYLPTKG